MSGPDYLEAGEDDIASWLSHPMTKAFLEWINWEASAAKEAIADDVMSGGTRAKMLAGRLAALRDIARACEKPAPLPEIAEPEFRDPAARRSYETHTAKVSDDLQAE